MPDREKLIRYTDSAWAQITTKYVTPDDGPVLEGGCGLGFHVAALRNLGYTAIGVDFAAETVNYINTIAPDLDILCADVRQLPFKDSCFSGYWSLGVIEHFWEGYRPIATEMWRVLRPKGILFLVFPYMNPVRLWKSRLKFFPELGEGRPEDFYQFALNPDTVRDDFKSLGFVHLTSRPCMGRQGMEEETPRLARAIRNEYQRLGRTIAQRARKRIVHELNCLLLSPFCYSMLEIFQKPPDAEFDDEDELLTDLGRFQ